MPSMILSFPNHPDDAAGMDASAVEKGKTMEGKIIQSDRLSVTFPGAPRYRGGFSVAERSEGLAGRGRSGWIGPCSSSD